MMLYKVLFEFNDFSHCELAVARSENEAIERIKMCHNDNCVNFEAEQVDSIMGYDIILKHNNRHET